MNQSKAAQVAQELEQAIEKANRALENAKELREKQGLGGADALALLEARMPAEDVAQIREEVQYEVDCIQRDAQMLKP